MNKLTIIEEGLEEFNGESCLVMDDLGNFFIVSTVNKAQFAHVNGTVETLAFLADEEGNILSWTEVAGGGDMTRADVLALLEAGEWDIEDLEYLTENFIDVFDVEDFVGDDEPGSDFVLDGEE